MHCMAHARRKFSNALRNDTVRAEYALGTFQKLYAIERRVKDEELSAEAICQLRQQETVLILKQLKEWMTQEYVKVLPKTPIGQAIGYSLPRCNRLSAYTSDPILNIDNNPVENAIRPVAIGRKNYLFAGSHDAAQRAAMVYSLFATSLKDVLEQMHLHTTANIAKLLPQNWKKQERG